ncbi:MAG: FHA domain-containing protein [Deltaproteobacteria bacterium]|nr:FHA domain-containing protein [Deltaproteobacteria bacterium]
MITCPKCTKDNQDHYKFCLGCGAELPRDNAPKPFSPSAPPEAKPSAAPQPQIAPPPAPSQPAQAPAVAGSVAPAGGTVICPQCSHVNAPSNLFCGSCGFRLTQAAAPKPQPSAAPQPSGGGGTVVLTALRADGTEAGTYALPGATVTVGRETGAIFAGDSYLSPRHATFRQQGQRVTVKDEGSLNGVYKKLVRDVPVELRPNDMFRIGQEIIKFEPLVSEGLGEDGVDRLGSPAKGYVGRIALVIGRDVTGNAFPIPETGVHLGRERGDVLFPEDGYVSGLHCRLSWEGGKLLLTDLGSSNGSFMRLHEETEIKTGDVLLMGQQLFRVAV